MNKYFLAPINGGIYYSTYSIRLNFNVEEININNVITLTDNTLIINNILYNMDCFYQARFYRAIGSYPTYRKIDINGMLLQIPEEKYIAMNNVIVDNEYVIYKGSISHICYVTATDDYFIYTEGFISIYKIPSNVFNGNFKKVSHCGTGREL